MLESYQLSSLWELIDFIEHEISTFLYLGLYQKKILKELRKDIKGTFKKSKRDISKICKGSLEEQRKIFVYL